MDLSDISINEAKEIQSRLSQKLVIGGKPDKINNVAGVDVAYINKENIALCVVVIFSYPALELLSVNYNHDTVTYPYIPGLLYLREGPIILKAFENIKIQPDIVIFDGHGIAHPRRFGLASHIGLNLNLPAIGCAKSFLYGSYEEPAKKKGSSSTLYDEYNKPAGVVLRSRENVKPVFISPGHLVGIDESVEIVMNCLARYRIPEPLRFADIEVNRYKKKLLMNF
ncbi:MAG: endonuclease V [Bacteroidales bacterium]|nr:MAG: endonuclease V [Bacteroidales bacterium]